jgi:hypothetical protein
VWIAATGRGDSWRLLIKAIMIFTELGMFLERAEIISHKFDSNRRKTTNGGLCKMGEMGHGDLVGCFARRA